MDYSFYVNAYRGTGMEEGDWAEACQRAMDWLESLKRKVRVRGSEEAQMHCICALAETMDYFAKAQNGLGGMQYASVGTVAVSGKGIYSQVDISPEAQERELYRCVKRYLEVYRGLG